MALIHLEKKGGGMKKMFMGHDNRCLNLYLYPVAFCIVILISTVSSGNSEQSIAKSKKDNSLSLKINLTSNNNIFQSGDPIFLQVELCNNGNNSVEIIPVLMPQDYFLQLVIKKHSSGSNVKFVGPEMRIDLPLEMDLKPGGCIIEKFDLASLFQLNTNDIYTVTAMYWNDLIKPKESSIIINSAPVQFTINKEIR
jgi:hypothetical protein